MTTSRLQARWFSVGQGVRDIVIGLFISWDTYLYVIYIYLHDEVPIFQYALEWFDILQKRFCWNFSLSTFRQYSRIFACAWCWLLCIEPSEHFYVAPSILVAEMMNTSSSWFFMFLYVNMFSIHVYITILYVPRQRLPACCYGPFCIHFHHMKSVVLCICMHIDAVWSTYSTLYTIYILYIYIYIHVHIYNHIYVYIYHPVRFVLDL